MAGIGGELNSLGHGLGRYSNRTCDGKMRDKILVVRAKIIAFTNSTIVRKTNAVIFGHYKYLDSNTFSRR